MKPYIRAETGKMSFEGDWPGVFIRGDNALHFAHCLSQVLETEKQMDPMLRAYLASLRNLLNQAYDAPGLDPGQKMKAFDDCFLRVPHDSHSPSS